MRDIKFPAGLSLDSTYADIGTSIKQIQDQAAEAEKVFKDLKEQLRLIQEELLPAKMTNEGVSTVNVDGVGRLTKTSVERISVKGGCQPELKEWLTENGYGALITDTINSSTLKSFVKERLREGEEFPFDLLNMHSFDRVTLTKK